MHRPQPGDLILFGSPSQWFELLDATTGARVAGPLHSSAKYLTWRASTEPTRCGVRRLTSAAVPWAIYSVCLTRSIPRR